jgi:hypothetical protein
MTETPESIPTSTPTATTAVIRPPGPSPIRIAIVGAGLVAILAGAAMTMAANRPAGAVVPTAPGTASVLANGLDDAMMALGERGPGHGMLGGGITITAINGSSLSLKTADGWTRTIAVTSDTKITKSGATIAVGDLKVGDEIQFEQTRKDDGTYTIDAIAVVLPHLGGEVTAVSGSTITVSQPDGTSATIKVTSDTTYRVGTNESAALSDVKVGMFVHAEGTKNADGSLTASAVVAMAAGTDGFGPGHHGDHGWPNDNDSGNGSTNG